MSMPQDPQAGATPQAPFEGSAADQTPTVAGATQPTVQLPSAAQPSAAQPTSALPAAAQPAPAYAHAPYGAPYQAAPAPARSTTLQGTTMGQTNTFAFLAIILAFISPIAGIVFGHMGLSQIKRTGDAGRGIALTGLIISYAWFAFLVVFMVLYIGFIVMMVGLAADSIPSYTY